MKPYQLIICLITITSCTGEPLGSPAGAYPRSSTCGSYEPAYCDAILDNSCEGDPFLFGYLFDECPREPIEASMGYAEQRPDGKRQGEIRQSL